MAIVECPNGFYDFVENNFLSSVNLSFPESPSGYTGQGVDVYLNRHIKSGDNYYIDTDYVFYRNDYFRDVGGEEVGYFFSPVDYTHYYPTLINQQTYSISMDEAYMFIKPEFTSEVPYISSYSQKDNHKGKNLVTFKVDNVPSGTEQIRLLLCPSEATSFDTDSWQTFAVNQNGIYQVEVEGSTNYVAVVEAYVQGYLRQNAISFNSIKVYLYQVYAKHNDGYIQGTVYVNTGTEYVLSKDIKFNV